MTVEEIINLTNAGYSKEDILEFAQAFEQPAQPAQASNINIEEALNTFKESILDDIKKLNVQHSGDEHLDPDDKKPTASDILNGMFNN